MGLHREMHILRIEDGSRGLFGKACRGCHPRDYKGGPQAAFAPFIHELNPPIYEPFAESFISRVA